MEEAFVSAAKGLFSLMVDLDNVDRENAGELEAQGANLDRLLYSWLTELLYESGLNSYVYSDFDVDINEKDRGYLLRAVLHGESIDRRKHSIRTEVKAITYQGLKVEQTEEGCTCRFVVDV